MPRKRRWVKHRYGLGALRPSVLRFLESGEIILGDGDNPWMTISLTDPAAADARSRWLRGDRDGAIRLLLRCSGAAGWFYES